MIQPIKPKRLFTGLVGMPPESENYPSQPVFDPAQVAPVATVLVSAPATSKKAGRTRKHKSDADRKATYYAKSTEAQRMALVAKIMWRVRAAVAKPLGPEDGYSANRQADAQRNISERLSLFRGKLLALSIRPLRHFYRALLGHSDALGRLPAERSGEEPQSGGMSETERLLARIVDGNEDDLEPQPTEPEKTFPISEPKSDSGKQTKKVLSDDAQERERLLEEALEEVAAQCWGDRKWGERVQCCASTCASIYELRSHLREQFRAGERTIGPMPGCSASCKNVQPRSTSSRSDTLTGL